MSLGLLLNNISDHNCSCKRIVAADDPLARKLGWVCWGCKSMFEIRLVDAKMDECPEWAKDLLMTAVGRVRMATILTAGCALIVMDEVAL